MLQVGVDCEEVSRFRRLPLSRNERFYKKIFTPQEIEYCTSFRDPYPRFTARFAAKEAVIKALNSINRYSYTDIEVRKSKEERPTICINNNRFKKQEQSNMSISLSLAHSNCYAIAFAIVTNDKSQIKETELALEESVSYVKNKIF